jgi:ADP-heptose:LPS heptosyltransferase
MPPELRRFAAQAAPLAAPLQAFDYFCPMLSLLHLLDQTITTVPGEPYLKPDPALLQRWRDRLGKKTRPRIGIAWSVGREIAGDYPRNVPLQLLNQGVDDADVFSLQMQGADEALAHCVKVYTFEDFADCAALMSQMDRIITVDTAAVHLAGAIGHPNVTLLLSHWASWRWCGNPFYPGIQICQQTAPGDWHSALSQLT